MNQLNNQRHKRTEFKPYIFYAENPMAALMTAICSESSGLFLFLKKLSHQKRRRGGGTCKSKRKIFKSLKKKSHRCRKGCAKQGFGTSVSNEWKEGP